MKASDNKAVDWVGTPKSQIVIFERVIQVLKAIQVTPIATALVVQKEVFQGMSLRTAQRYLYGLEQAGYIKRKESGRFGDEARFFLTDKAKQLFGMARWN